MNKRNQLNGLKVLSICFVFLFQVGNAQSQGFMKKLAAAMAPKPLNGVWELTTGGDGKFAVAQVQTQFKTFEHAKENADKKMEIQYDGISCSAARFTSFSISKIYTEREQQPNWWLFQTQDSTFFIVGRMNNYKFDVTKDLLGVITSDKALMTDIVGWNPKNPTTSELLKSQLKEVQNLCDKITQGFADKEKEEAAKAAAAKATYVLPPVSSFVPSGVTQKAISDAFYKKFESSIDAGTLKFTYAYVGSHPTVQRVKTQKEWSIIKENKLVNGTYDNYVTKRALDVICVVQTAQDIKDTTYSLFLVQLYEDAAFGVYDGSKWSGTYYITGHMYADPNMPKEKMLKNKSVLK